MRVATKMIYDNTKYRLGNLTEALNESSRAVSSGKRINTSSDDPVAFGHVLDLNSTLSNLDQLERNINTGRTWLETGESVLTGVKELLLEARDIASQMSTDSLNADNRRAAADHVNGLLQDAIALANTHINGNYIFAGTQTNTKPFELIDDPAGTTVEYSGDLNDFYIKTGKYTDMQVGHNGQDVFGDTANSLFKNLIDLREALESNDVTVISGTLSGLEVDMNRISGILSSVGYKGKVLDIKEATIVDARVMHSENKQALQDADLIEAISDLTARETAYQAALAASSKVMNLSLVDYLK